MRPAQTPASTLPQAAAPQMRPTQSPAAAPQASAPQMKPAQKRPPVVIRPQKKTAEPKKEEKKELDSVLKDLELDKW